jgi:Zn-dependent M28 family amino/carboxypeptidase
MLAGLRRAALVVCCTLGCTTAATEGDVRPATPASTQAAAGFDAARAWEHLRAQVAIGPRVAGTPANAKTRQYIVNTLAASGIKAVEQHFDARTPMGPVKMANVIATLEGERRERIILASHFDTKRFTNFRFVGASDGASSTAALLELARLLKDRPRPFTIELLFFDGEEAFDEWDLATDSTYGSRHYVQAARSAKTLSSIKALILLDMIGDKDLNLRREENSTRWLTDVVWATARRLGHARRFLDETVVLEDDHLHFVRAGIPAVDIIDFDYHAWHTVEDTLENVSADSVKIVGDVVLAALPEIERRLLGQVQDFRDRQFTTRTVQNFQD